MELDAARVEQLADWITRYLIASAEGRATRPQLGELGPVTHYEAFKMTCAVCGVIAMELPPPKGGMYGTLDLGQSPGDLLATRLLTTYLNGDIQMMGDLFIATASLPDNAVFVAANAALIATAVMSLRAANARDHSNASSN